MKQKKRKRELSENDVYVMVCYGISSFRVKKFGLDFKFRFPFY